MKPKEIAKAFSIEIPVSSREVFVRELSNAIDGYSKEQIAKSKITEEKQNIRHVAGEKIAVVGPYHFYLDYLRSHGISKHNNDYVYVDSKLMALCMYFSDLVILGEISLLDPELLGVVWDRVRHEKKYST